MAIEESHRTNRSSRWGERHTLVEKAALIASITLIGVLSLYVLIDPADRLLLGLYMVVLPVALLGFSLRRMAFDDLAGRIGRSVGRGLGTRRSYEIYAMSLTLALAALILWMLRDIIYLGLQGQNLEDMGVAIVILSLLVGAFAGHQSPQDDNQSGRH